MTNHKLLNTKLLTLFIFLFSFYLGLPEVNAQKINQFTKEKKRTGVWKKYYSNKRIRYVGTFLNGKEVGVFNYYDITTSKHPIIIKEFSSTSDSSKVSYYNLDGKLRTKGTMLKKNRIGKWVYFFPNGTIFSEEFYTNGKLEGILKNYYKNGNILEITQYSRGMKNGVSEKLSLNGARSFYGTTKLSSEMFIQEYAAFYGLKAAITRFGVIAGPRQMGKTDQGVVTLWMAKHYWNQSLKYIGYGGEGKQVRDLLHVDDVVKLIDLQIHQIEKFEGKIYNVGGGIENSASLLEMTSICEKITGNKIKIASEVETRTADLRIYITDNSLIEKEIGWKPTKNVEQIFTDIFHWIKENENHLEPILK